MGHQTSAFPLSATSKPPRLLVGIEPTALPSGGFAAAPRGKSEVWASVVVWNSGLLRRFARNGHRDWHRVARFAGNKAGTFGSLRWQQGGDFRPASLATRRGGYQEVGA